MNQKNLNFEILKFYRKIILKDFTLTKVLSARNNLYVTDTKKKKRKENT